LRAGSSCAGQFNKINLFIESGNFYFDFSITMTFSPQTIAELFTQQAIHTPEAVAVQSGGESISYAALNERANQLGRYLQALGVGPDQLVGICLERSLDLIVSILGVLKAGGAYVPLDPAYPAERLDFMLKDSGAAALIATNAHSGRFEHYNGPILSPDSTSIFQQSTENLSPNASASSLAYVIYTSGSTGQPKGVMVEQRGWLNYVRAACETYGLGPSMRMLQFASISWDTSAEEIFPCLTSGATLVLRSAEMVDSIPRFLENCAAWGIHYANLPTAFWHELVAQMLAEGLSLPPSLRVVIIGGERAHWEFLVKWRTLAPAGVRLFNTYGQTECTAVTLCGELTPDLQATVVPLGVPVENVQVYLLDEQLRPVPDGQPGELFVGGPGVARGYLNQPELTGQKFISSPFAAGGRLYRTGDLLRRWPDGSLEFVGRADQQVKIRGIRIEPGEIEATLAQHPAVRVAAVVGQPLGPSPEYLAAYIVANAPVTAADLRDWLHERLPIFLIPAAFVFLDALPLTPNGKLDRRALPLPDFSQRTAPAADSVPQTETQAELQRIWQDVLGQKSIGINDDFFEIGGHSLLATRVVARVRQRFHVDLSLRTIFDAPSIAELSEHIQNAADAADEPTLAPRQPGDPLYTSFAQESLWFLDQMVPGNPTYNISDALKLSGPLDVPALERAINRLVARHENLRTRFENVDGQPVPVIVPEWTIPLPVVDIHGENPNEQLESARKLGADEAIRPFNLQTGPLMRLLLARLAPENHILIIVTHHIISDGWSIAVFFEELSALYTSLVRGETPALPPLPVQFADYALWQRRFLQGDRLEAHLGYWRETLKDVTPLQFPLDRPRAATRSFRGARLPVKFSPDFTAQLQSFSHAEEATLFMLLLSALQATLSRYTAQTDITLGTAIANRHQPELDGLIGFFVNTLVLRTDLGGDPTFRELLQRVRETTLGAYAHQAVPFERIVQALAPRRAANRNPLFDAMLFLQNVPPPHLNIPNIRADFLELEQRTSEFDFVFDLTETPNGLQGFCEYDTDLFDAATMRRLIGHFQTLLAHAVSHPDAPVSALPLLTVPERTQLLVDWNQTARPYPDPRLTIPDLFEQQAARTPDQTAARMGGEQLTYAALNARANQVAHQLLAQGVQTESIVGVCLERSLEMLAAVLGILKAGAAYLPLDPAYPLDRLQFMLADSGAGWLVTNPKQREKFNSFSGKIVDITDSALAQNPTSNPARGISGENACYIVYTSGSTGRPKGVTGLHRAALNRFQWMWETYPFTPGEVCAQKTALSFVDSVWEMFGPLLAGIPLVVIPDAQLKDTRAFVDVLARERLSRLVLVPSLLRLMLETFPDLDARLPDLRLWVSSGEALPQDLADEFARRLPGRILLNLYGSSEVAADSTFHEIRRPGTPARIGRPIANTQVYLLDAHRQPVPLSVTGEIYIGGMGLSRGYWQRPDLTAERFLPNPFSDQPDSRLYKTGDLGRYWPDGSIEYIGRVDFQVKIRGFRVELGEVQNVISQHPAVKQALVVTRESAEGPRLVAYTVASSGADMSQLELRKFAESRLPEYMVPSAWVSLEAFPLTPSGKIDQRALPAPGANIETGKTYVAPRNEMELRLVKLWEHLLETSPVGVEDNFFEIGGHSLLVVRLMTQLEKELGKPLSLALIFHAPTIALMANALRDQGWKPAWSSLVPIRPQGSLSPLFCVHADGGAFFYARFADYLSPEQPFYGLQARGLDGTEPPFTSVEAMAAHYLAEMRTIQPRGPYIISGFSMGGVVIYEMARQSMAAGDPPPLVVFLDAPSPDYFEEQDTRLTSKLVNLTRLDIKESLKRIQHRIGQRYRKISDQLLSTLYMKNGWTLPPALRIHRVREMNHLIADKYEVRPYAGPITVLRASQQIRRIKPDNTLGWGGHVIGKISDYEIPGDHETIFHEPNVRVMAETLQNCIDVWRAGA
jgi:amino acid adenylation domain-containing protein